MLHRSESYADLTLRKSIESITCFSQPMTACGDACMCGDTGLCLTVKHDAQTGGLDISTDKTTKVKEA